MPVFVDRDGFLVLTGSQPYRKMVAGSPPWPGPMQRTHPRFQRWKACPNMCMEPPDDFAFLEGSYAPSVAGGTDLLMRDVMDNRMPMAGAGNSAPNQTNLLMKNPGKVHLNQMHPSKILDLWVRARQGGTTKSGIQFSARPRGSKGRKKASSGGGCTATVFTSCIGSVPPGLSRQGWRNGETS